VDRSKVGEHSEHSAMPFLPLGYVELEEDVAYVRLDRAQAEDEPLGDGGVGESLGHKLEHASLTLGEAFQGTADRRREQRSDDLRVEGGPPPATRPAVSRNSSTSSTRSFSR
jgi:hypothetical protein